MVRARLALLGLASSFLLSSGCVTTQHEECNSSGSWLSRFRLTSRNNGAAPCDCNGGEGGVVVAPGDGSVVVPPNSFVPPPGYMPPNSFVPPQGYVPPGGAFPASPPSITNGSGQPPRIVPVPQANPMPYSPQ